MRLSAGVLIVQDSKVLAVKAARGYGLPFGKVEANETLYFAALRELFEETGYIARMAAQPFSFDNSHCFIAEEWRQVSLPTDIGGEVCWVEPSVLVSKQAPFREFNKALFHYRENL